MDRMTPAEATVAALISHGIGTLYALPGVHNDHLFDALFNGLRSYFILTTASRIDIRLSQLTFRHLMRLPISFFDHARAGVVTKHMQQGTQIREFLTGRLLGTLLDLPALLVFLPLLLWYSAKLTMVVLAVTALLGLVIAVMAAATIFSSSASPPAAPTSRPWMAASASTLSISVPRSATSPCR